MSILNGIALFDSLSDHERDMLSLYCQERFMRDGEVLFQEGDDAIALYIVKSGMLKVYKERSDGERVIAHIGPGNIAGEMAIFEPGMSHKRMASICAVEDTVLLVIMDYAILELSKKHPEIYEKISQIMYTRKSHADKIQAE